LGKIFEVIGQWKFWENNPLSKSWWGPCSAYLQSRFWIRFTSDERTSLLNWPPSGLKTYCQNSRRAFSSTRDEHSDDTQTKVPGLLQGANPWIGNSLVGDREIVHRQHSWKMVKNTWKAFNPLRTEVYFCHQKQNTKNIGNFSAFSVWTQRGLLSPHLRRYGFAQRSSLDEFLHNAMCVSWLCSDPGLTTFLPGELKWRWARYSILQVWSANSAPLRTWEKKWPITQPLNSPK
jgi:hypothetical protein